MHDTIEAMTEHLENIMVIDQTVVLDLASHLNFVDRLLVAARTKNLQHDVLASLVPVLGKVHLCVGSLIDFLFDLIALVNHHGLALA